MGGDLAVARRPSAPGRSAYVTKKSVAQTYASRTMRWGGVIIALFIVYHILDLTVRRREPRRHRLDAVRPAGRQLPEPGRHDRLRRRADPARHAPAARDLERHPDPRAEQPAPRAHGQRLRDRRSRPSSSPDTSSCRPPSSSGSWTKDRNALLMPLELFTVGEPIADTKAPTDGPIERALERAQVRGQAGQPGQPPQAHGHRRRHRPGRRLGRRDARRGRLPGQVVLLPGLPAPRALDRRAGRHQRRQELPQRRRLASTGSSTTRSRAATSAPASPTSTGWPRSASTSSTSASPRACPFAREYGGLLDNRSFGGVQVSRTFYARGQTGQQLLIGAYQALERQIAAGTVEHARRAPRCST